MDNEVYVQVDVHLGHGHVVVSKVESGVDLVREDGDVQFMANFAIGGQIPYRET